MDVCDLRYINSKYYKSACWHPTVKIDEKFKKGEKLGIVRDFFCNTLDETYAEYDGIILYMYGMMPISPFDLNYAMPEYVMINNRLKTDFNTYIERKNRHNNNCKKIDF